MRNPMIFLVALSTLAILAATSPTTRAGEDKAPPVTITPESMERVWIGERDGHRRPPLSVTLLLESTAGHIIDTDERQTQLTLGGRHTTYFLSKNRLQANDEESQRSARLRIDSDRNPTIDDDGTFLLEGSLALRVAGNLEGIESKSLAFEEGRKIVFDYHGDQPPPEFTIAGPGNGAFPNTPASITLTAGSIDETIANIKFSTPDGEPVQIISSSRTSFGLPDQTEITYTFNFNKDIDEGILILERWTDLQTITLPISLKLNIHGEATKVAPD